MSFSVSSGIRAIVQGCHTVDLLMVEQMCILATTYRCACFPKPPILKIMSSRMLCVLHKLHNGKNNPLKIALVVSFGRQRKHPWFTYEYKYGTGREVEVSK